MWGKHVVDRVMTMMMCMLGHVRIFVTPQTGAHQDPLSMEPSRKEYRSGPFPTPGDLSGPGIKPASLALAGRFVTIEPP